MYDFFLHVMFVVDSTGLWLMLHGLLSAHNTPLAPPVPVRSSSKNFAVYIGVLILFDFMSLSLIGICTSFPFVYESLASLPRGRLTHVYRCNSLQRYMPDGHRIHQRKLYQQVH